MGAAVALDFTLRFPPQVIGLVISRPAWLDQPFPAERNTFLKIAKLIRQYGAIRGVERFKETNEYQKCLRESPDSADSLLSQFSHPRAEETVPTTAIPATDASAEVRAAALATPPVDTTELDGGPADTASQD